MCGLTPRLVAEVPKGQLVMVCDGCYIEVSEFFRVPVCPSTLFFCLGCYSSLKKYFRVGNV